MMCERVHGRVISYGPKAYKRSEEHTSELQSQSNLVCRLLLEKKTATLVRDVVGKQLSEHDALSVLFFLKVLPDRQAVEFLHLSNPKFLNIMCGNANSWKYTGV